MPKKILKIKKFSLVYILGLSMILAILPLSAQVSTAAERRFDNNISDLRREVRNVSSRESIQKLETKIDTLGKQLKKLESKLEAKIDKVIALLTPTVHIENQPYKLQPVVAPVTPVVQEPRLDPAISEKYAKQYHDIAEELTHNNLLQDNLLQAPEYNTEDIYVANE